MSRMTHARECPYCGGVQHSVAGQRRKRHPHHSTVKCAECSGYYVRHANGRNFPLTNKADKESDAVTFVRD